MSSATPSPPAAAFPDRHETPAGLQLNLFADLEHQPSPYRRPDTSDPADDREQHDAYREHGGIPNAEHRAPGVHASLADHPGANDAPGPSGSRESPVADVCRCWQVDSRQPTWMLVSVPIEV